MFLVAITVDGGVSVVDWQVYCPPCDVCRGLNERVRVVGRVSGSRSPHCDATPIGHCSAITGVQPLNS